MNNNIPVNHQGIDDIDYEEDLDEEQAEDLDLTIRLDK
jgi:hypothetical protein